MNLDLLVFILEIIYPKYKGCIQMSNELQFSLNKINEIKDYFIAEIKERELMSKRPSNHFAFLTIFISH